MTESRALRRYWIRSMLPTTIVACLAVVLPTPGVLVAAVTIGTGYVSRRIAERQLLRELP